jgi:Transcriptional regulator
LTFWFLCLYYVANWLLLCEILNFYQLRRFIYDREKGMELRHLRYFVAVAQELNFTRAAEKLHTSQPSLSSQIRDLEQCVGVSLLERDKRKVTLTTAGECFLPMRWRSLTRRSRRKPARVTPRFWGIIW